MSDTTAAAPSGIGGWLSLVVIGLILTPLLIGYGLLTDHLPIFQNGSWQALTTPGTSAYHPLWAPLIIFEIVGNISVILLALVTLVSLFGKSRRTPAIAITYFGAAAAFVVADYLFANAIPVVASQSNAGAMKELVRTVVIAAVWIPYFLVSKRVKATFVE